MILQKGAENIIDRVSKQQRSFKENGNKKETCTWTQKELKLPQHRKKCWKARKIWGNSRITNKLVQIDSRIVTGRYSIKKR